MGVIILKIFAYHGYFVRRAQSPWVVEYSDPYFRIQETLSQEGDASATYQGQSGKHTLQGRKGRPGSRLSARSNKHRGKNKTRPFHVDRSESGSSVDFVPGPQPRLEAVFIPPSVSVTRRVC